MRKVLIATFVSITLATFAAPAFAEDDSEDDWNPYNNSSQQIPNQKPPKPNHGEDRENEAKHNHLKEKYDDVSGVVIPPVAIKPDSLPHSTVYQLPNIVTDPDVSSDGQNNLLPDSAIDALTGVSDEQADYSVTKLGSTNNQATKTAINPTKSAPVQIKSLNLTTQTPADDFMAGALFLGSSLGVVAVGLLGATAVNQIRLRRKP